MKLYTEMLIIYSPLIPHFTSECWDLIKNKLPTNDFNKQKGLLEQNWPLVDSNWKKTTKKY